MTAEQCYMPTKANADLKGYVAGRSYSSYVQRPRFAGKAIEREFITARDKRWHPRDVAIDSAMEQQFRSYLESWKEETAGDSSLSKITGNINYLRIMTMGERVIPLILRELQREPAPWFLALRALSKDDSIGRDSPGDFRKIASAWIRWGKQHAFI